VFGAFSAPASSSASNSSGGSSAATSAYYAAEAAQGEAGDQLQAEQIAANASTAQAQIASQTSITNNQTWANQEAAVNNANNQAQLNLGALNLDYQENEASILNAQDQFALNVGAYDGTSALTTLENSGYFAAH